MKGWRMVKMRRVERDLVSIWKPPNPFENKGK